MSEANRLTLVVLEVTDLDKSTALYRDGFGVDLHQGVDNVAGEDRWISGPHAEISWREGAYLHFALYQAKTGQASAMTQVGFLTDDLDAAHVQALTAGALLIHEPRQEPWGRTARYSDFDGNVVSLTQSR